MAINGRVFTASLKPAWTKERMQEFCNDMLGVAMVYAITHDKDVDSENGVMVEAHSHIYIEYDTPRNITTVANLLEVENNFIEIVRNKQSFLRYLTHMDDKEKHQYTPEEVFTNSPNTYYQTVMANTLTDKDIAKALAEGKGYDLLGLVSASRIRTIQSLLHFGVSREMAESVQRMEKKLDIMQEALSNVNEIVIEFKAGFIQGGLQATKALEKIAEQMGLVSQLIQLSRTINK